MKISKKAQINLDGKLVIKVAGAVAGFAYKDGMRTVFPIRGIRSYPFIIKPNPITEGTIYYLFGHDPPIYVNQKVVFSHPSEICEVILLNNSSEMALPK